MLLAVLCCLPVPSQAQGASAPALIEVAPDGSRREIDGDVSPAEWAGAARIEGWLPASADGSGSADLWIDADDRALRLAMRIPVPEPDRLLTRAPPRAGEDTLAAFDDSLEIWLAADPEAGHKLALRLVFNARAARWDARGDWTGDGWVWDPKGTSRAVVAARVHAGTWAAEIEIPRSELAAGRRQEIGAYGLRIVRQQRRPSSRVAWPPLAPGADPLDGAARILVRDDSIVVSKTHDAIGMSSRMSAAVDLRLGVTPVGGCAALEGRVVPLDAGAETRVPVPRSCAGHAFAIELRDGGDGALRFRGGVEGSRGRRVASRPAPGRIRGLRLDVAYYPYASRLRWRVDPAGAHPRAPTGALDVRVRRVDRDEILARAQGALDSPSALRGDIELPPLADGSYRATVTIGDPADPDAVLHRDFEHRTFGWEHNRLGLEPEVIPPFEPLTRDGRDLRAVLRRHRVGAAGLLAEIDSLGAPVLAAPMRFEVALAGSGVVSVEPDGGPRFVQPTEGRIDYETRWRAGALRATTRARMDVDGLLWIDLELPAQPDVVVSRLDLVIPVRADVAELMNVVTDRTRHNESGRIPRGEGIVWRSAQARRIELQGTFVPYVWLGDGARGLAFVAASDRDWVAAEGDSLQVIERDADSVTLRVRLIGEPIGLERARRLGFGLQATPTKPRPFRPTWRLWQPSCKRRPPALGLCVLATTWEWGGATTYGSFEPAAGNEGILEALAAARAAGRVPDGEVERWLTRRTAPSPRPDAVRRSLAKTFTNLASRPAGVVAYMSSHTVGPLPELEVYRDEWSPAPFSGVRRSALLPEELMATFPSRSWQDFALWHLNALLESGAADGFFIDNTFLSAVFDEVSGAAYRDEAGMLRPATDLLELRSFMRRLQTLAYQKRGRWLNVSHMTNSPVAPVQTWSAAILDGELRYGPEPFGDRFSRDWLRAESIGDQVGALPLFLPGVVGVRDRDERERVEASVVAGAAVHEIRVFGGASARSDEVWGPLHRFGYGQLDARVHRYWDPSPPFQLTGIDGEALVVARDGEAMALVVTFGEGGVARLVVDGPALGLSEVSACRDATTGRGLRPSKGFRCDFLIPEDGYRLVFFGRD